ncbi:MAG TPA: hypothetical protein DCE41_04010 [Cytophagales bacterium]|nr:hypothetical protein [Cytophagales bacterium]HAA20808.1 hypothetical protein [Cytophagales bacterium]HAP59097.1 hypothetical protein [Cytophagales bacterium]
MCPPGYRVEINRNISRKKVIEKLVPVFLTGLVYQAYHFRLFLLPKLQISSLLNLPKNPFPFLRIPKERERNFMKMNPSLLGSLF